MPALRLQQKVANMSASLTWASMAFILVCSRVEAARVLQQTIVYYAPPVPLAVSAGPASSAVTTTQATRLDSVTTNQVTPQQGSQWASGNNGIIAQAGSAGGSGDPITDPELQATLDLHNQFRAKHQVGPLSWSAQLQASAQRWADQCVFQHSGPGENLAQYFTSFASVTQAWYDEVKDYRYDGQFSYLTGHFTEMVWKASTQLGCGYNTGCQLYVCHYNPSGNVLGSFQENVFPPIVMNYLMMQ